MKSVITFLIVISSFLPSLAQEQSICLPDSVVGKIIDELLVKDHLQFTVNKLDSTLTVYKHTVDEGNKEITKLKLNAQDYQLVISNLREEVQLEKSEVKRLKRKSIKEKIISFLEGLGLGVSLTVIYIIAHKV